MSSIASEKNWRRFFQLATIIKGVDGVLGIIVGTTLLFVSKGTLNREFVRLVGGEIVEKPRDFIINYFYQLLQHMSVRGKTFVALYILSHGILNVVLVIGLYKEKLWAYWWAIGLVGLFIFYLLYKFLTTHSGGTLLLMSFDIFFVILAWHEYNYRKKLLLLK